MLSTKTRQVAEKQISLLEQRRGSGGLTVHDGVRFLELAATLNRANTVKAVAAGTGEYCRKALGIPAGMIFVERDSDLHLLASWRATEKRQAHPAQELISTGPVARAFRKGEPVFWNGKGTCQSLASRYLWREFMRSRNGSLAFLPLGVSGQQPVGVLALVVPHTSEFAASVRETLLQFARMISESIVRARMYDEALAARAGAENAMQRRDEFISVLSHELKNPMTPILNWALALNSGTLAADKQTQAIDAIVRNVRALNYLIDDLFDVSRISSGKLCLQASAIRIQEVVREVLLSIQPNAEAKKLRMSTDIDEAIPPFLADARRLRQVLSNLLNNAIKFTPEGGSVSLRVRKQADCVECTVTDTGKGIEPRFLPFVFDKFSQENPSAKGTAVGLGLGLAIAHEIVRLHGGSIKASSHGKDRGAAFVMRLPMRTRKKIRNHRN